MKLETERLILRELVKDDWQRVLEYQSNPLYLRYYEWTERTPEAVQEFVGWFLNHQSQEPRIKFQLAIVLKSSNQLIGNCGVRMNEANALEADIGYELDPNNGITVMLPKPRMPLWISGSVVLMYIAFGHGALKTISALHMCWRN